MKYISLIVFGYFLYVSYYFWLMYPKELEQLFKLKDKRLSNLLSKIWFLNINARAFAIHKLMIKANNQRYIEKINPSLKSDYFHAKRRWLWALAPIVVLIVISQFEQGYEILFNREQFQEKIDNSWFSKALDKLFK